VEVTNAASMHSRCCATRPRRISMYPLASSTAAMLFSVALTAGSVVMSNIALDPLINVYRDNRVKW